MKDRKDPHAVSSNEILKEEFVGKGNSLLITDILLSSAGWVGLNIPVNQEVDCKIWTPETKGIFIRQPSLIPYGGNLHGGRIGGTLAYRTKLPFVKPKK